MEILETLKNRFLSHPERHLDLRWEEVEPRLSDCEKALETLKLMEDSGGEPDVIGTDEDGKLPDWFMVEIVRDLPRLIQKQE